MIPRIFEGVLRDPIAICRWGAVWRVAYFFRRAFLAGAVAFFFLGLGRAFPAGLDGSKQLRRSAISSSISSSRGRSVPALQPIPATSRKSISGASIEGAGLARISQETRTWR